MKLLVKELKGYSFRLVDLESKQTYRAMKSDFKKLIVGSLLEVAELKTSGNLILSMKIESEVLGDRTKPRQKVFTDDVKLGDLVDGVPVVRFGLEWAEKGKRVAYAYFN